MKRISNRIAPLLLLSLTLVFFPGCSGNSDKKAAEAPDEKPAAPTVPISDAATAEEKPDTATAPQPSGPGEGETPSGETTETSPEPTTPAATAGGDGLATRTVSDNKLTTALETIARELEAKNLAYVSSLGQDCSGIFHQIKDSVQIRIPALADKSKYTYPSFRDDRNSRQIADWYYRHNNLHIVQDPMADRNKIRPGTVMFFGRTDEHYSNMGIGLLSNADKFIHDGQNGKIYHVAIVTSVEKDEQGNVTKYTIMHGRNTKYPASRSSGNYDGPGGFGTAFAQFPFGNWNQQWVAMAHIETPVN